MWISIIIPPPSILPKTECYQIKGPRTNVKKKKLKRYYFVTSMKYWEFKNEKKNVSA